MSKRLTVLLKIVLLPLIFFMWLFGVEQYVGEDSFVDYWRNFDE